MMSEPDVKTHYERPARPAAPEPPPTPVDTGSRALEEALRSSLVIIKGIMAILVIVFVFSGVRAVGPQERAIKLRFGKAVGVGEEQLLGPGFHWAFPYPIEEVVTIPVGQIQTVMSTVGWYAMTPEQELAGQQPTPLPSLNPATEGYTLTADGNIVHARATLRYRITDPLAYAFNYLNGSNIVQNVLNNALLYASARTTVDDALLNTAGFKEKVLAHVDRQIAERKLGITLEPADVTVSPPPYVKEAFTKVLDAEATRSAAILNARGYAEATVSKTQSDANALLNAAEAERTRLVEMVRSDARAFADQLPQYRVDPALFRQRKLIETWQNILTNASDKFYLPARADGKPQELRLQLNREPKSPRTGEPESQP